MPSSSRRMFSAVKHGAYAATVVLPGEDRMAYEKLHKALISEFKPRGVFEREVISDLAGLMWRKRHLGTYRLAELARARLLAIEQEKKPINLSLNPYPVEQSAAVEEARAELGEAYDLIEMGQLTKLEHENAELVVLERLDAMIDRTLRRLLFARGIKSTSAR